MHSHISNILPVPKPVYKKSRIPKALREQVWLNHMGPVFEGKCRVTWCSNTITAFDFQCGHNIPESKGGKTNISNLIPICARCNISMGDSYSIADWNVKFAAPQPPPPKRSWFGRFLCRI
jgi:5-methylcytosine-specific restriction endonuclease McrA